MSSGSEPVPHDPVIFFHVMKCGGTSVRAGLSTAIASAGEQDIFELKGQAALEAVGGRHADNWQFRNWLLPYLILGPRPSLILGHFRYRDEYEEIRHTAHFVTVLRHPLERFVSLYKYRRHKDGVDVAVTGSFEDFLDSPRWQKQGHLYSMTFCGREGLDARSDEAIGAAIHNLQKFAVVGEITRLDDFCRGVTRHIGKPVEIPRSNESPAPEGGGTAEIAPASLARARELCAPDQAIYDALFGSVGS